MSALEGIRVLELASSISAAYCARQFALWGADVAVIDGRLDQQRRYPTATTDDGEVSLLEETLHLGKRKLPASALDARVVTAADVVIVDSATAFDDLGVNPDKIPIVVDISPYGRSGPLADYAATDHCVEAMSGYMSANGASDRAPLRMPGNLTAYICGVSAFVGALAAYHEYAATGRTEAVEVSCMETLATIVPLLRTQLEFRPEARDGGPGVSPLGVRLYEVNGGYLSTNFALPGALDVFADVCGMDASRIPEHLSSLQQRQNYPALHEWIRTISCPFSVPELFKIFSEQPYRTVVGQVQTPADLLVDPQLHALGFFRDLAHPALGNVPVVGPAARMSESPALAPAPVSPVQDPVWPPRKPPNARHETLPKPLSDIRIIDLTQAWIGPYATQLLADLGAEVIKVESHVRPDVWRRLPPTRPRGLVNHRAKLENISSNFNSVNCGKQSLTLDLTTPRGRQLFLELIADADLVMENFTPRVMARFGLDYDRLADVNPRIIMASFSGYGREGPYADYRATGTTIEATAGWDSLFGYHDGPPLVMGFYQADAITGLQMAATTLAALAYRDRTGRGQHVEGSMFEAATGYLAELVLQAALGENPERFGNHHPDMAPHGVYPCLGEDRWVAIGIRSDAEFAEFCDLTNLQPGLAVDDLASRLAHGDALDERVAAWTRERTADEVVALMQRRGLPAAPVKTTDEVLRDPHLEARGWFQALAHPDLGCLQYDGAPWRFSESIIDKTTASPRLGQHSRELLAKLLNLSAPEIDKLFRDGVTGREV